MAGRKTISTIKIRRDFLAAAKGSKFVTPTFILQVTTRPDDHPVKGPARVGYTVTKKMGNAPVRSRIKRRLRAAVKKLPPELAREGCDYVIISRNKAAECDFADLVRDMQFAFSRITAK